MSDDNFVRPRGAGHPAPAAVIEPPRISLLSDLHPDLYRRALDWLAAMAPWCPVILETRRTPERQDWLYASGRTRPGLIVTHLMGADPRASHVGPAGSARAFDFAFKIPGFTTFDERNPWAVAGAVGEYLGLLWGGRWKSRDLGHLQLP